MKHKLIMEGWRKFLLEQVEEYTVQTGDTLSKIAKSKNTTVKALANLNKDSVKDINKIFVGQKIKIPSSSDKTLEDPPEDILAEFGYHVGQTVLSEASAIISSLSDFEKWKIVAVAIKKRGTHPTEELLLIDRSASTTLERVVKASQKALRTFTVTESVVSAFESLGIQTETDFRHVAKGFAMLFWVELMSKKDLSENDVKSLMGPKANLLPNLQDAYPNLEGISEIKKRAKDLAKTRLARKVTPKTSSSGGSKEAKADKSLFDQLVAAGAPD